MRPPRLGAAAAGLFVLASSVGALPPAPAFAGENDYQCDALSADSRDGEPVSDPSEPVASLDVDAAQQLVADLTGVEKEDAGAGVRVAVVDSGVVDEAPINRPDTNPQFQASSEWVGRPNTPTYYHGTAMAGIVAGAPFEENGVGTVGIAPGAEVVDVKVYDEPQVDEDAEDDPRKPLEIGGLVSGLEAIVDQVGPRPGQINIVTISLAANGHDESLRRAVEAITREGAIVVTSSGNRTLSDLTETQGFEPGEDLAGSFFPAAYAHDDPQGRWEANPRLVVAGSVIPDGYLPDDPPVALSSDIDVVVPTTNAVSYGVTTDACRIVPPSTSVAAAEVSGILALLEAAFPDEGPDALIKRLEVTASGETSSDPSAPERIQGKGVVQPIEALTRTSVKGPPAGTRRRPAVEPAIVPEAEPDVLAGTRGDAVWWGLAGGGGLIVALILRPVLARRRREEVGLGS